MVVLLLRVIMPRVFLVLIRVSVDFLTAVSLDAGLCHLLSLGDSNLGVHLRLHIRIISLVSEQEVDFPVLPEVRLPTVVLDVHLPVLLLPVLVCIAISTLRGLPLLGGVFRASLGAGGGAGVSDFGFWGGFLLRLFRRAALLGLGLGLGFPRTAALLRRRRSSVSQLLLLFWSVFLRAKPSPSAI